MNINAWPFLVSCNQHLDYRTVAAPNFICEAKISGLLKAATADQEALTEQGSAIYREIHNSKVGDITLVFRVVKGTNKDIGIESNDILKDKVGRVIYLIEGIVLREPNSDIVLTEESLEKAHKRLVSVYSNFWKRTSDVTVVPQEYLDLEIDISEGNRLKIKPIKPYIIKSKSPSEIPKDSPLESPIIKKPENIINLMKLYFRNYSGGIFVVVLLMGLMGFAFFFRQVQP
ncbi:hypothetical protein [Argonema galeatum]|uniref:hypothetical protein n=1 Tax=Argonema galeatum TaxID=2942762 RepID=UPI0020110A53|nr:hypothetical protein [Argonema galeatum]MCL1464524.1 hypothetical protein [Argonema galeatum A003/A1]